LIPKAIPGLLTLGANVVVESGAGVRALLRDTASSTAAITGCGSALTAWIGTAMPPRAEISDRGLSARAADAA
jgi:NAD/NADP transhydrogenase alpha subunit